MGDLYHGSVTGGLKILEPRPTAFMNDKPLVWAAFNRGVAISFIGRWDDSVIKHATKNGEAYMKELRPGAFEEFFKGVKGYVYTVDSEYFDNRDERLYGYEAFSEQPVPVKAVEEIPDAWEALKEQTDVELIYYTNEDAKKGESVKMDKRNYFVNSLREGLYVHKKWVIEVFSIVKSGSGNGDHFIIREPGKAPAALTSQKEIIQLDGALENERLYDPQDTLILEPGELQNVKTRVETTYGVALINAMLLCYAFGDKVDYVNDDPISGEKLDAHIASMLAEYPPAGKERDHSKIYVDELLKYLEACAAFGGFGAIFSPTASPKSLTINPAILKRRDELFKEHAHELHDPVIIAKIDKELTSMDRADFKGDPAENFFIKSKAFDVSRKKALISYGLELGFNPETPTFIPTSLNEGLDFNNMPAIADSSRSGSYSRGAMTALGGQSVKDLYRVFQNVTIDQEDCGSKGGMPFILTNQNKGKAMGRYALIGGKLVKVDDESIGSMLGQTVLLRSPYFCKSKPPHFCARCVGERTAMNPTGVHVEISDVGSAFMYAEMKAMHGKSLATAKYDVKSALS